ncbi:MAG: tagaturonate epimerase family protein [Phycisphaerae bacterium]
MDPIKLQLLKQVAQVDIYDKSIQNDGTTIYFLGRDADGNKKVGMCATEGHGEVHGENRGKTEGKLVTVGPADHANAEAIRRGLPWTAPRCIGLSTSAGLGDRLGLATPGHIRAMRAKGGEVVGILAQQSIREMTRTNRTPDEVMDAATFGVLQEGYTDGFGSDADHLQKPEDIDVTVKAGFTMFTIDPGLHVVNDADTMGVGELANRYDQLDFDTLRIGSDDLKSRYDEQSFDLEDGDKVSFGGDAFLRAAVKYGGAVAHTVKMYQHLKQVAGDRPFELEVSVDETESPTSPAEHYFFAAELKRLGVEWVSMAPRFVGRFEKGVDYIGDLDEFRASFKRHAAVMRTLGPYKISIHSGSDKFSIYPLVAEMTGGLVHLKTAGTSYLEALRAIAKINPGLYREILDFARGRYEVDKATYHVSADVSKVPPADSLSDEELPRLLDNFDARQTFHVTFGSVLTNDDFRSRFYDALRSGEEAHYAVLATHLGKHVEPLAEVAR